MAAGSYERKEFTGGASPTYLAGAITGTPSSFSVPSGTGATFPDGSTGPFVVVVGRGTATEEKILCTSRASDVFTINTRGYDDTTAIDHETGEDVEHVLDASTIDQANRYVNLQSAKGSVVLHDGTNAVSFAVGTNGYTIVADSTAASGWAWSDRLTTAESNITTLESNVTALQGTDIVVTLTGDVTGEGTITNLGNVSFETTVVDDSHDHTIANVDGLQDALDGKLGSTAKAADSDKLDNLDSTQFLRSDADDTTTGTLTVGGTTKYLKIRDTVDNSHAITFATENLSGGRTITFPNATGTVALTSDFSSASVSYATNAGNADTVDNYNASSFWKLYVHASTAPSDTTALWIKP